MFSIGSMYVTAHVFTDAFVFFIENNCTGCILFTCAVCNYTNVKHRVTMLLRPKFMQIHEQNLFFKVQQWFCICVRKLSRIKKKEYVFTDFSCHITNAIVS